MTYSYHDGSGARTVFYADVETRRALERLARAEGLRGVAFWRVGFEYGEL